MKQSVRSPFTRVWLFVAAMIAAVAIPVFAASSASAATQVANPGPFTATLSSGNLKVGTAPLLDLSQIQPAPTLTGTMGADGNFTIPASGVNFPQLDLDLDGNQVRVYILPVGNWTGNANPDTGAFTLNARIRVRVAGGPGDILGSSCYVGDAGTSNISLAPATSGSVPANGEMPATQGSAFNPETGEVTVVNNTFSVPEASGCGPLGAANATVNDGLGLPAASGKNSISMGLTFNPTFQPPVVARYTATPELGRVPFPVEFDATESTSTIGPITSYQWDFDGDDVVDETTTGPTTSHVYETPGIYETHLTVVSGGVSTTRSRATVEARAVVVNFTEKPPAASTVRDVDFAFEANEEGATFECRFDTGGVPGTWEACESPVSFDNLPDNDYTYNVRATVAGSTGLATSWNFRVDNINPVASVTGKPANRVSSNVTSGNVAFQADETATFECRFTPTSSNPEPPETEFGPCISPTPVSWDPVEGTNTFEIRPTDRAGNVGAITTATWEVDLTPPVATIPTGPPALTNQVGGNYAETCSTGIVIGSTCLLGTWNESATPGDPAHGFTFGANEGVTNYRCTFNDGEERDCPQGIQTGMGMIGTAGTYAGPRRLGNPVQGTNTLKVWAIDDAGNRQTNPTTRTFVYDSVRPTITHLNAPPAWTKTAAQTLIFQSNEPVQNNSFQCRFITNTGTGTSSFATGTGASTGWVACDPGMLSPTLGWFNTSTVPGLLTDGRKGLQVRATDMAGNVHTSNNDVLNNGGLTRYWTVDNAIPVATFAAGSQQQGSNTTNTSATINLASTDTPLNFSGTAANGIPGQQPAYECSLNAAAFAPCTTPVSLTNLTPGAKSFRVRVTDQSGNVSAIIERNWTVVDATNASVELTQKPPAISGVRDNVFAFTPDNGTAECRVNATEAQNLNGTGWSACASPKTFTAQADGTYQVEIRKDASSVPAVYNYAVFATAPAATFQSQPGILRPDTIRYTGLDKTSHSITFSAPANPAYATGATTFECRYYIDGQTPPAFTTCASPQDVTWNRLSDGQVRKFEVRPTSSTGVVGNVSTASWTIVSTRPAIDAGNGNGTVTACGTGALGGPGPVGCVATANSTQPALLSNVTTPRFQAVTSKPINNAVSFACQLNGGTVQNPCTARTGTFTSNPLTVSLGGSRATNNDNFGTAALSTAPSAQNTFKIWAVDNGGNLSAESVDYTWTVDTTTPGFAITSPTPARTNAGTITVDITANEDIRAVDGFKCRLTTGNAPSQGGNPTAWTNCTNVIDARHATYTNAGLAEGTHTLDVKGYDLLNQANTANTVPSTTDNLAQGRRYTFVIDRTAPVSSITAGAAQNGFVGTGTGQFAFQTNEPAGQISGYQCRMDVEDPEELAGDWSACTSPYGYEGLEDGEHTFQVRALDTAGNQGLPLTRTFTVDSTKPEIELSSDPDIDGKRTKDTTAHIEFTVDPANSTAECRLIGPGQDPGAVAWTPSCASPRDFADLADGDYTFQVRATNTLGVLSETSGLSWTIDTVKPDVTIDDGPGELTDSASAEFEFSSTTEDATFACQLDEDTPEPCESPQSYDELGEGDHTFKVIATDDVGNVSEPASSTWEVDLTAPDTTITSAPAASTEEKFTTFGFESDDTGATFTCALDEQEFSACESPLSMTVQTGDHQFRVRATDVAGNTGDAAEHSWTVTEPPACEDGQIGTWPDCEDPPEGDTRRIVASLTEGSLSLGALGDVVLPADQLVMDGALYPNGDWIVSRSGATFQPVSQTVEVPGFGQVTVKISLSATSGGSGSLTNGGGAAEFDLPVQAKIEAALGSTPLIGPEADCALRPVDFDLSGTYDEAGEIVTLGSETVAFPTVSAGCGDLGVVVNGLLELPRNDIALGMTFGTEISELTECPPGQVGTPPNCVDECPDGQIGTPPDCEEPPCPTGQIGTPPNCEEPPCPTGQIGTPPNCEEPPTQCEPGQTGTPPNCVTPPKTAPSLTGAKISAKKKVKSGGKVTIRYSVTNSGDAAATNVKVCLRLKKAKKLAAGKAERCKTIKSIAPGKKGTTSFVVKTKKITAKKKPLNFAVSSTYKSAGATKKINKTGHVTLNR